MCQCRIAHPRPQADVKLPSCYRLVTDQQGAALIYRLAVLGQLATHLADVAVSPHYHGRHKARAEYAVDAYRKAVSQRGQVGRQCRPVAQDKGRYGKPQSVLHMLSDVGCGARLTCTNTE